MTANREDRGLYDKYIVRRADREDRPGYKHDRCQLFVLDLTHDPHAIAAAIAYADSCAKDYPALANDLNAAISKAHATQRAAQDAERQFREAMNMPNERRDGLLESVAPSPERPEGVE